MHVPHQYAVAYLDQYDYVNIKGFWRGFVLHILCIHTV